MHDAENYKINLNHWWVNSKTLLGILFIGAPCMYVYIVFMLQVKWLNFNHLSTPLLIMM